MSTFRDDLLADIDTIRAIPGEFGVHLYQVWVRVTTYAGDRPGKGAKTVTDTRLLVGGQDPHVREIRSRDAVAGSEELKGQTLEVGPLTPGVTSLDVLDPARTAGAGTTEFLVKGPGLPTDGALYQRTEDSTTKPFRYMVTLKAVGRKP